MNHISIGGFSSSRDNLDSRRGSLLNELLRNTALFISLSCFLGRLNHRDMRRLYFLLSSKMLANFF